MSITPDISVILPVYNSEKYLNEAVTSILSQTFTNFELIIINDGSNDNSLNIIEEFMSKDRRIRLVSRENRGLVLSLNEGIGIAKGSYIARMDADDICLPTRLEDQLAFMEINDIDLCGSWVEQFTHSRDLLTRMYPEQHEDIIISLIFYNSFAHPSTMIRSKVFEDILYGDEISEDYQLWCKIVLNGYKVGNIPKVLLKYRKHEEQITNNKSTELLVSGKKISMDFADALGDIESEISRNKIMLFTRATSKKYLKIAENLDQLINKYNASVELKFDILLFLYLKSYPKTPLLYYHYRRLTAPRKKNFNNEVVLFMKSFLYIKPNSKLLYKMKNIYRNTKGKYTN